MSRGSPELTATRKNEIMDACEILYGNRSFKEITLKDIGDMTTFTRTSIYNYFHTKEEIFLALFQREYEAWNKELEGMMENSYPLDKHGFAEEMAESLGRRVLLLKILSVNLYDMEGNSRMERLVSFKAAYGKARANLGGIVRKFFPDTDEQAFLMAFLPFMHGIYPYAFATEKQKAAMDEAHVDYKVMTIHDLVYDFIVNHVE